MKVIIASSNLSKIKEFQVLFPKDEIIPFKNIIGNIKIVENGNTFQENAIIKARAIYKKLKDTKNTIIISDDSGISVPIIDNEPNIYSARYAGINATDIQNNKKLIQKLKEKNIKTTPAFYTVCIALIVNAKIYTVHSWLYGNIINKQVGNKGFGYDPMFIPNGFHKTLGELDTKIKQKISHRSKAIKLAKKILEVNKYQ